MTTDLPALPHELAALLPAALHAACALRHLRRGDRVFASGQRPAWMHFVIAGEVTLERMGEDGERVVLQRVRHGLVAEASLLAQRYHCDAVAATDTALARVQRQAVLDALRDDTAFALRWISMQAQEVRRLRQQCERLSLNTVEARLMHLLRTEGGATGIPLDAGLKTLAREIGVTHEALYRCVSALEKRGVLSRSEGRLRLQPAIAHAAPGRQN